MCKNKAGLKAHKRVHSNEYKCDVCQKGFIIKKNFILHKKNYHSKICNECGKECLTALALKTHERKCFMKWIREVRHNNNMSLYAWSVYE